MKKWVPHLKIKGKKTTNKEDQKKRGGGGIKNIMLLKGILNDIVMNFDMNFTNEGENILKKAASDERMIYHKNLFFKTGDTIIKNFDSF